MSDDDTSKLVMDVRGLPAPQGSKRHMGNGVMVESSRRVKPWREDVKQAALTALDATPSWARDRSHVALVLVFSMPRPKAHWLTGRNAHKLRDNAPHTMHGRMPDLDKLVRSTCDALSAAGVYEDDARVCSIMAVKTYAGSGFPGSLDTPGAHVELTAMKP